MPQTNKLSFNCIHSIAEKLLSLSPRPKVIGIDGWLGAGKSYLGRKLAPMISGTFYDLDSALALYRSRFVEAINLDHIRSNVIPENGTHIVSGVCLLQVMQLAGISVDQLIYVKRMSSWGWADEDELRDSNLKKLPGSQRGNMLRREVSQYHLNWNPIDCADFEYHRSEDQYLI